jgi:hypothetical protein
MSPKITLPWIKVLDDYLGGLVCNRCGAKDDRYKFPNSPGANMKAARDFQDKHKDCTEGKTL